MDTPTPEVQPTPTPAPVPTSAQKEATTVEGIVNEFLPLTALGGPIGGGVAAGITAAEGVANTILASTASHQAPLEIAAGAVTALAANAAPVIAMLPEADQTSVKAGVNLLQTILAGLKAIPGFGWV